MDAAAFQPAQVLGNAVQYQQLLASKAQQQQQQNAANAAQQHDAASSTADTQQQLHQLLCASGLDPASISPEVWAAACLLGSADKGLALLALYRCVLVCVTRGGLVGWVLLSAECFNQPGCVSVRGSRMRDRLFLPPHALAPLTGSWRTAGGCACVSGCW